MIKPKIAIHQPNFFPWLGYFYKIAKSDVFVLLDEVDYPKSGSSMSSLCNRTKLMGENGLLYFSHSVERKKDRQPINTVMMAENVVLAEKLKTILSLYKKAPFYKEISNLLEDVYSLDCNNLSVFNINAITKICMFLEIDTKIVRQSTFKFSTQSSELLKDLVCSLNGGCYLAGAGGSRDYLDLSLFHKAGIRVEFISYPDFQYKQFHSCFFTDKLSIIDVLMNCGKVSTINMLKK